MQSYEEHSVSVTERSKNRTLFYVLGGMCVSVLIGGLFLLVLRTQGPAEGILLPTLDLQAVEAVRSSGFSARLIGDKDGVQIYSFTEREAQNGFKAPKDSHVLFACPADTTPGIKPDVAHGDRRANVTVRYWGYEYSGHEEANAETGLTHLELFDGRFHLSQAELSITRDRYGYLHTENMRMQPNKRYYLMIDGDTGADHDFFVSCLDSEGHQPGNLDANLTGNGSHPGEYGDGLNNGTERAMGSDPYDKDTDDDGISDGYEVDLGTDPTNADTDGDSVQDGTEVGLTEGTIDTDPEVFVPDSDPQTVTNPLVQDSDNDGLSDGEEDADRNGRFNEGETDPNDPNSGAECGDGKMQADEQCDDGCAEGEPGVCEDEG